MARWPVLVALVAALAPAQAHALDVEANTITCTGFVPGLSFEAPADHYDGAQLDCTLGHVGNRGYTPLSSFSAEGTAWVYNSLPTPGANYTYLALVFSDGGTTYDLEVADPSTRFGMAMVNPEDEVRFGDDDFVFHVREGHVALCAECPPYLLNADTQLMFTGEYLYDLPA